MAKDREIWRMRLVTRAPLHVGSAVPSFGPMEVAVAGDRVYRVGEDRLLKALVERGLSDRFVILALQEGRSFTLQEFLEEHGLLTTAFLREVAVSSAALPRGLAGNPHRFRPFVRDGLGRPYIPGSSIKGALRTAILYMTLARMEERDRRELEDAFLAPVDAALSRAEAAVRSGRRLKDKERKFFSRQIQEGVLQQMRLAWRGRRKPEHQRATAEQRDLLRVLQVSDSTPWDAHGLEIQEVRVLSLRNHDREPYLKHPPIYMECLPAGTELTFTLNLDRRLLNDLWSENAGRIFLESLSDVLTFAREFSRDVAEFEKEYLNLGSLHRPLLEWYQQATALDLRLGWGSGWHATTLGLLLSASQQERVRDLFFAHRRQSQWVPKSRRVVVQNGEPVSPLGWVSLERME